MYTNARTAAMGIACLLAASAAQAQVDCRTPREQMNSVAAAKFAPIRQTLLSVEELIYKNAPYQDPPEPVRMRTTLIAGPSEKGGGRIFVRAYPEKQGTIQIWTKDRCDVIPQSERVAASVGQIYVFINYNVEEQFLRDNAVPKYEGEYAGFPIYNGWIVMTKDKRLPWIPQTLGDRLDQETAKRQRAIDDWNETKAGLKVPDEAAQMKTYEMLKQGDPAGAEKFLATVRDTIAQVKKAKSEEPIMDAHLQRHLQAVRDYRATFTAAQLNQPAMWTDPTREGQRRLDTNIAEFQRLPREKAFFLIQDARADYDLTNVKPGPKDQAMAFKPDPAFPDFKDPFRPQLIMITFWSKSDPKDNSPRTQWLRKAKEAFDFPALAALLR